MRMSLLKCNRFQDSSSLVLDLLCFFLLRKDVMPQDLKVGDPVEIGGEQYIVKHVGTPPESSEEPTRENCFLRQEKESKILEEC